jgi:hypothetical protein
MKYTNYKKVAGFLVAAAVLGSSLFSFGNMEKATAYTYDPILSITQGGSNSGMVIVTISGAQPYSPVSIYYTLSGSNQAVTAGTFGSTDYNGNLSIQESWGNDLQQGIVSRYANVAGTITNTVSSYTYSVGGSNVYGNNGYGYYGTGTNTNSTPSSVIFSPSNPNLYIGQSATVNMSSTYSNSYSNTYYLSATSTGNIVSATISGSTLQLYALNIGSTTLTICTNNNYSTTPYYNGYGVNNYSNQCGYLYVTVTGSYNNNGYGCTNGNSYYSNSNSNAYCGNNNGNGYYGNGYGYTCSNLSAPGTLTFSPTNLAVAIGQQSSALISGNTCYGSGTSNTSSGSNMYSIYSNQNPGIATVSVYSNQLVVTGVSNGTDTVVVCANNSNTAPYNYYSNGMPLPGSCGTETITVSGSYNYSNGYGTGYGNTGYGTGYGVGQVLGITGYPNGEMVRYGQEIGIIYNNTFTPFANYSTYTGFGFGEINPVSYSTISVPTSSHIIGNQYTSHPWGSWVSEGSTIYFVSQYGLIPIPNYSTFTNNGGQTAWVVPANSYDYNLQVLSPMSSNDSRLQ